MTVNNTVKTVVVLGLAYGGLGPSATLARYLPAGWKVIGIDRNSHMNHVYVFPRYTVKPQYAPRAFVPLTKVMENGRVAPVPDTAAPLPDVTDRDASSPNHEVLQGIILKLEKNSVTVLTPNEQGNYDDVKDDGSDAPADRIVTVPFSYALYALGAGLPAPSDVWGEDGRKQKPGRGQKAASVKWLSDYGEEIKKAKSVLVVGGGALGIQFATDIKDTFKEKDVTLLHSRTRLLPIYHQSMHDTIVERFDELGIKYVLGERVMEWPVAPDTYDGKLKSVRTDKGSELSADLVLVCTGTRPHVEVMAKLEPDAIAHNGCINVRPTMQVEVKRPQGGVDAVANGISKLGLDANLDHIFAVGDCVDVKCIRAGHNSAAMGSVAARNIVRLVNEQEGKGNAVLENFKAGPDKIKVSLGLSKTVFGGADATSVTEGRSEDLDARGMWVSGGAQELADDV